MRPHARSLAGGPASMVSAGPAARGALLLALGSLLTCAPADPSAQAPRVRLHLAPVPSGTVSITVTATFVGSDGVALTKELPPYAGTVNERPVAEILDARLDTTLDIELPIGAEGRVAAWVRARDQMGCVRAQGSGEVTVDPLRLRQLDVTLERFAGAACLQTPAVTRVSAVPSPAGDGASGGVVDCTAIPAPTPGAEPPFLPTTGGQELLVSGAGFFPGTTVQILPQQGAGAPPVTAPVLCRLSSSELLIRAPDLRGAIGQLTVRATGPDGATGELPKALTTYPGQVGFRGTVYSTGRKPVAVALGDLSGDGTPDIVTANADIFGPMSVLLNKGDGRFSEAATSIVSDTTNYQGSRVTIADLDGKDGLDVLLGVQASAGAALGLIPNPSRGSFPVRQGLTYTSVNSASVGQIWGAGGGDFGGVAVLRLGAGQPRALAIATGISEGRVRVYPPDPQSTPGLFQLRGPGLVDLPAPPYQAMIAVDIDLDGLDDVVLRSPESIAVLRLTRSGTEVRLSLHSITTVAGANSRCVAAADLDQDGFPEILLPSDEKNDGRSGVWIYFNQARNGNERALGGGTRYVTGRRPTCVASGDFNGDGLADLAVLNSGDNTVSILLGQGRGRFPQRGEAGHLLEPVGSEAVLADAADGATVPASGPQLANMLVSDDVNGDGKADLVIVTSSGQNNLSVLLNTSR